MGTSTIRILREVNGYKQDYVAEILEMSQNTYSRLEQDPSSINAKQAQKLSELYNVSIANLLSDATPVLTFRENSITNNSTSAIGYNQGTIIQSSEKEIKALKEEIEYLRKQNSDLLRIVGERK
jgi:transcriptional regulator with XRE-family HTH domain